MKCPVCKTPDLLMTERQSIEIDYCPSCRGVWLDRGELDKLLEQTPDESGPRRKSGSDGHHERSDSSDIRNNQGRRYDSHDRHGNPYDPLRKRKSLFDIFDFD
ncbi:zf-TFIIB domain-containing protein (plasmid) [Ralstonia solanacearum]|uniref:TFIIB-type zinc ribbon-containing protein n=1 Tax=Ralstonia solanacearum TaxID=305 RepID=UPI0032175917